MSEVMEYIGQMNYGQPSLDFSPRQEEIEAAWKKQDEEFKAAFEWFFSRWLRYGDHSKTFIFPDVTNAYAQVADLPQPRKDFRCVGYVAVRAQKEGRIKVDGYEKDPKSGRIIPRYRIL